MPDSSRPSIAQSFAVQYWHRTQGWDETTFAEEASRHGLNAIEIREAYTIFRRNAVICLGGNWPEVAAKTVQVTDVPAGHRVAINRLENGTIRITTVPHNFVTRRYSHVRTAQCHECDQWVKDGAYALFGPDDDPTGLHIRGWLCEPCARLSGIPVWPKVIKFDDTP